MSIKLLAQGALTAIVIFFIFKIVADPSIGDKIQNAAVDNRMEAATGVTASAALGVKQDREQSIYNNAAGETDVNRLSSMARMEADRMVRSGDTSAYQKELENNPLLQKIIGNQ